MSMNRRSFLAGLGALAASLVVPRTKALPATTAAPSPILYAVFWNRELIISDLSHLDRALGV